MSLWGLALRFPMLRIQSSVSVNFLLPARYIELSAPAPHLPECCHAPHHDDNGLNLCVRDWDVAVIALTMFLFVIIWSFCVCVRKAVECFMCCLIVHTNKSMGYMGTDCNFMNCGDQEVSEEKNVIMWPRNWSYNIFW